MSRILEQKQSWNHRKLVKDKQKVGLLARLFRCRHKELSRPFTVGKESHRTCTQCGARRNFDPETLQTYGDFYFPLEKDISQLELN